MWEAALSAVVPLWLAPSSATSSNPWAVTASSGRGPCSDPESNWLRRLVPMWAVKEFPSARHPATLFNGTAAIPACADLNTCQQARRACRDICAGPLTSASAQSSLRQDPCPCTRSSVQALPCGMKQCGESRLIRGHVRPIQAHQQAPLQPGPCMAWLSSSRDQPQ